MTDIRGAQLASVLNGIIDSQTSEEMTKADIVSKMAGAAGIDPSTVNQILSGSINCPPTDRLQGFAEALGVSLARLQSAAEEDGCSYERTVEQGIEETMGSTLRAFYADVAASQGAIEEALRELFPAGE